MVVASHFRSLPPDSLLHILPDFWEELGDDLRVRSLEPNEDLIGEETDEIVVPLEPELRMDVGDGLRPVQIGRLIYLAPRDVSEGPRPRALRGPGFGRVLAIAGPVFRAYLGRHPGFRDYANLRCASPAFQSFDAGLRKFGVPISALCAIAREATWIRTPAGEFADRDALYFTEAASFEVSPDASAPEGFIPKHAPTSAGAWFGGFSLVPGPSLYRARWSAEVDAAVIGHRSLRREVRTTEALEWIASEPCLDLRVGPSVSPWRRYRAKPEFVREPIDDASAADILGISLDSNRLVRTTEESEAVPTTLKNFLALEGITVDADALRERLELALEHLTWSKVAEVMELFPFTTRAGTLSPKRSEALPTPFFWFLGNRLIAVLRGVAGSRYLAHDAVDGFYLIDRAELTTRTTNTALFIESIPPSLRKVPGEPTETDSPERVLRTRSVAMIRWILSKNFRLCGWIVFATILIFSLEAATPYLSQAILDEVLRTDDRATLTLCLTGLGLTALAIGALTFLRGRMSNFLVFELDRRLSAIANRRALDLRPEHLERLSIGGVANRIAEMDKIRAFFSTESLSKAFSLVSVIVYLGFLFAYSWKVALIPTAYIVLVFLTQNFFRPRIYRISRALFQLGSETQSFLGETISKMIVVKAFGAQEKTAEAWERLLVESTRGARRSFAESTRLDTLVRSFSQAAQIGVTGLSVYLVIDKSADFSIGEIFAIGIYMGRLIAPANDLAGLVTAWSDIRLSLDRMGELLFPEGRPLPDPDLRPVARVAGKLKLENLGFRYSPDSPWILRNVSLTVYPGQSIAFVGPSGAGKTTLVNLIAGTLEPTEGKIYFDDRDRIYLDPQVLRAQIGYVQQDAPLFSGTLESNIAYADDSPRSEAFEFAAHHSRAAEFIRRFPARERTFLGEGGLGLSSGQRQRVAIARILYRDPKLLILDESTSALDAKNEAEVIAEIRDLARSRTTILIAHRVSTVRWVDRIFFIDGGGVVQTGTHEELIRAPGRYADLFHEQSL